MKLGPASRKKLEGVHTDLIVLASTAIQLSRVDFGVTEGLRTRERQSHLVQIGASKTMRSRHLTGHAIDVVAYDDGVSWAWPLYEKIYQAFTEASEITEIPFEWGGNWESFKDGPHFQLSWEDYP